MSTVRLYHYYIFTCIYYMPPISHITILSLYGSLRFVIMINDILHTSLPFSNRKDSCKSYTFNGGFRGYNEKRPGYIISGQLSITPPTFFYPYK
jgi:hypothetical protein